MAHVERVAAARVVHVLPRLVGSQTVIRAVVDATKTKRRPELVRLRGVVIDDVEDDFDARRMQRLDHRLEFVHVTRRAIPRVRREEADRVVTPIVAQPILNETAVVDEVMHGHQLDGGHAETAEVIDHRRCGETRERAAQRRRHLRMLDRETAHVELVDHHIVARDRGGAVVAPGERTVDHLAFRHGARAVATIERQVAAMTADGVPEDGIAPAQRTGDMTRVRIEEELVRIEPQARFRSVGPVHAVAIERPRARLGKIAVEDLVGALRKGYPLQFAAARRIEDAEIDGLAVLGEQRKIDALAVPFRAARIRAAGPDFGNRFHRCRQRMPRPAAVRAPASSSARARACRRRGLASSAR